MHVEIDVGVTRERTVRVARDGNKFGAFSVDDRNDGEKFVGTARIGNADDDIVNGDHAQVTVSGFGGMHEKGGRTGGS